MGHERAGPTVQWEHLRSGRTGLKYTFLDLDLSDSDGTMEPEQCKDSKCIYEMAELLEKQH